MMPKWCFLTALSTQSSHPIIFMCHAQICPSQISMVHVTVLPRGSGASKRLGIMPHSGRRSSVHLLYGHYLKMVKFANSLIRMQEFDTANNQSLDRNTTPSGFVRHLPQTPCHKTKKSPHFWPFLPHF